jgi:hypothetical protein
MRGYISAYMRGYMRGTRGGPNEHEGIHEGVHEGVHEGYKRRSWGDHVGYISVPRGSSGVQEGVPTGSERGSREVANMQQVERQKGSGASTACALM